MMEQTRLAKNVVTVAIHVLELDLLAVFPVLINLLLIELSSHQLMNVFV